MMGRSVAAFAALARALDLVQSRRSLTVVLVGPRRAELIQGLAGVARVLTVGSLGEDDGGELRDALAVLLPLEITTEDDGASNPWAEARDRMSAAHPAETKPVLAAAEVGTSAVKTALKDMLAEPVLAFYAADENGDESEE